VRALSRVPPSSAGGPSVAPVSRRGWLWGAVLLLAGAVLLGVELHAIAIYRAPEGSPETATLGQVGGALVGSGLLLIGVMLVGTGLRRRLEVRRRRRLRDRLAADEG
jgi:drug/metabolite transporter (DMT)-like permease